MPLHFRKSVKVAPGVRINFGKKSTSVSIGPRSAKITTGTNGTHVSSGIPGTGLYYREKISGRGNATMSYGKRQVPLRKKSTNNTYGTIFLILAAFIFASAIFYHFEPLGRVLMGGIGAFSTFGSVVFFTAKSSDTEDKDYSNCFIKNPIAFAFGVLVIIGCFVVYTWANGATWTGHSKTNYYIRYDYTWARTCLYFILVVFGIMGAIATYSGFKKDE